MLECKKCYQKVGNAMNLKALSFKQIDLSNVEEYAKLTTPDKKFHCFNGPYFKKETVQEHAAWFEQLCDRLKNGDLKGSDKNRLIVVEEKIVGVCSWHWRSKETNWLEVGIIIFEDGNWSKGIGTVALGKWIDIVFAEHPEIVRIGLTTWSGNLRMVGLSEKIGLKREACYKNARIVDGQYYDSVSYGILREEWQENRG